MIFLTFSGRNAVFSTENSAFCLSFLGFIDIFKPQKPRARTLIIFIYADYCDYLGCSFQKQKHIEHEGIEGKTSLSLKNNLSVEWFFWFFVSGVVAAGCFQFVVQRIQVHLSSLRHKWKTYGWNPSTLETGFIGFLLSVTSAACGNPY